MMVVGTRNTDLHGFAIPSCGAIAGYSGYVDEHRATFVIIENEPCTILACQKREIRGRHGEQWGDPGDGSIELQ